jgi:TPR repeat protein
MQRTVQIRRWLVTLAMPLALLLAGATAAEDLPLWEQATALMQSCRVGDAVDCRRLAALYETGSDVILKDVDRAEQLYQRACQLGDAPACSRLSAQHIAPATSR